MAYIEVIDPHEAGPRLKSIYEELIVSRANWLKSTKYRV